MDSTYPGIWNMGRQLGKLNNSIRDNLPIASMEQSQNTFIEFRLAFVGLTHRTVLNIYWKYAYHISN